MENVNEIIFSVSEFIELLNIGLKKSKAKIIGEVSDFKATPGWQCSFCDFKGTCLCPKAIS